MITSYPVPLGGPEPAPKPGRVTPVTLPASANEGSWRYGHARRSRKLVVTAAVVSISLHAALFFGVRRSKPKPVEAPKPEFTIRLAPMPELKDLEELEPAPTDDTAPPPDMAALVPMQADLPQAPQPNDFVQTINLTSLLDAPDLSNLKVSVIPENYLRGGKKLSESIGKIFNLDDLDRHPEPVLQPAPNYPHPLRREGISASVMVEFIVDTEGRVLDPVAIQSTHSGFNDAAVSGVSRWKFKPGIKNGRKVNCRMRVPILFKVGDIE